MKYFPLVITLVIVVGGCAAPSNSPACPDDNPISKGPSGGDFSFLETKTERGEFD